MKKLIIALLLTSSLATFAQEKKINRKDKTSKIEKLTPEQRTSLQVKELTLKLDLSDQQQKEITEVIKTHQNKVAEQKSKIKTDRNDKLSAEQRFELKNQMLDQKIEYKKNIKKILNDQQFEKWSKIKTDHKWKTSKKMKHFKGKKFQKDSIGK